MFPLAFLDIALCTPKYFVGFLQVQHARVWSDATAYVLLSLKLCRLSTEVILKLCRLSTEVIGKSGLDTVVLADA